MWKLTLQAIFALGFACLSCSYAMAQDAPSIMLQSIPMTISAQAAIAQAERFLKICDLPPSQTDAKVQLVSAANAGSTWEIHWNGDYEVDINATTGQPVFFDNNRRIWEQVHQIRRDGQRFINQEAASAELWRLARALDLPADGYLARFDIVNENDPTIRDANKAGSIGANFSVKPNGYPFLGRGNGMSLVLDPVDGQLIFFCQSWNMVPSPANQRLTKQQATEKGLTAHFLWHSSHDSPYAPKTTISAESNLGYIQPNNAYSDTIAPIDPFQVKLAWLVHIGDEDIYIDAKDGTVIGGKQIKQTNRTALSRGTPRPAAEYKNPLPIHQAIQSAVEVRIYGDHNDDWDAAPFAVLNSHSHKELFRLLKTTNRFGNFGVRTIPDKVLVFVVPGYTLQGYYFNGRLSKANISGETAILPDRFTAWLRLHPYLH